MKDKQVIKVSVSVYTEELKRIAQVQKRYRCSRSMAIRLLLALGYEKFKVDKGVE